jgi:hypothetical protein
MEETIQSLPQFSPSLTEVGGRVSHNHTHTATHTHLLHMCICCTIECHTCVVRGHESTDWAGPSATDKATGSDKLVMSAFLVECVECCYSLVSMCVCVITSAHAYTPTHLHTTHTHTLLSWHDLLLLPLRRGRRRTTRTLLSQIHVIRTSR